MTPRLELFRTGLRYLLAAVYFFVGVVHLRSPDVFLPIVPEWVPFPRETVLVTGACEIAGAVALLTTRLRYAAGLMLALYAVCVFPANVKHALEGVELGGAKFSWWYHAPRLAFQPVFVWWALFCGGVTNWPLGRSIRDRAPEPGK